MEKITSNKISKQLVKFVSGGYEIVLPNYFYGPHECDLFRITQSDLVIEYEIKISRSDYFNDFKKGDGGQKHYDLKCGTGFFCPNRFFFVVPEGLVDISEVPAYAGLIYFRNDWFDMKKSAKLLHKKKFTNFRSISHTLSARDQSHRAKINRLNTHDFDKEINYLKREVESERAERIRYSNELFMLKHKVNF